MSIRPTRLPAASTKLTPVVPVVAWRSRGMTPIRSATGTAGPLTSTGLPLDRSRPPRSTTVTRNPCPASQ